MRISFPASVYNNHKPNPIVDIRVFAAVCRPCCPRTWTSPASRHCHRPRGLSAVWWRHHDEQSDVINSARRQSLWSVRLLRITSSSNSSGSVVVCYSTQWTQLLSVTAHNELSAASSTNLLDIGRL